MGRFTLTTVDMKSLLFACLVALAIAEPEAEAAAEADPWLYYSNHYNYAPSVYSGYRPHLGYNSYPYAYQPVVYSTAKVEDSEAAEPVQPAVPVTYTYPYTHPTVYNAHPTVYNTYPSVYSYNPFIHSVVPSVATKKVVKREAEPAAEAEADPWYAYPSYQRPYAGYRPYVGYSGYSGYSGYGYSGYRPYGQF